MVKCEQFVFRRRNDNRDMSSSVNADLQAKLWKTSKSKYAPVEKHTKTHSKNKYCTHMLMGKYVNAGMGHKTQLHNVAKWITSACKSLTHNDFQIQKEYLYK